LAPRISFTTLSRVPEHRRPDLLPGLSASRASTRARAKGPCYVRYSVYTPRANVEQTFVIDGTTGTYSEVMPKRCRDGFHPIGSSSGEIVGMLL
jgi:hypothetical protein